MSLTITADQIIDYLNKLLEIDKDTVKKLIEHRVDCPKSFADHPTVQVLTIVNSDNTESYKLGVLGVINGLFDTNVGYISAEISYIDDSNWSINKFLKNPDLK